MRGRWVLAGGNARATFCSTNGRALLTGRRSVNQSVGRSGTRDPRDNPVYHALIWVTREGRVWYKGGTGNTGAYQRMRDSDRSVAQAWALREQAAKGGLRFDAYLPPDLAMWLLDQIEHGVFADPSEAVFVILGEHRELEPHADLRQEMLRRSIQAAVDDPRPSLSAEGVEQHLHELAEAPRSEPAIWRKKP
jgi:antitoxin ParD1/3/4